MSTRWARRQLKQSQRRETWRMTAFALFGIAFGVAIYLALEATDPANAAPRAEPSSSNQAR